MIEHYLQPSVRDLDGRPEDCQESDCPDCDGEGHFKDSSDCCGTDIDEDTLICLSCKEHSGFAECENCKGTGRITN